MTGYGDRSRQRRWTRALISAVAAMGGLNGGAVMGQSPTASAPAKDAQLAVLDLEAATARLAAMSRSPAMVFDSLSAPPARPGEIFADLTQARWHQVSHIFRRSVQYAAAEGDAGCTAWYDPFVDVWMIAGWSHAGKVWEMRRFGVALGDASWTGRQATLVADFAGGATRATHIFETHIAGRRDCGVADPAKSRRALTAALKRGAQLEDDLLIASRAPGFAKASHQIRLAIDGPAVPPDSGAGLAAVRALPTAIRQTVHPVATADMGEGTRAYLLQSPIAPATVAIIRLKANGDEALIADSQLNAFFAGDAR